MDADPFVPPRRLLLASDLTSRGDRALDRARALASHWQAELHLVHAVPPAPDAGAPLGRDPREDAQRRLRRDVGADEGGLHVHLEESSSPAAAILAVAARIAADLLVLGESRDRVLDGFFEGTLAQVMRQAPASVLVVRDRPRHAYRQLLAGTDFTDEARQSLVAAAALFPQAAITLLHAYDVPRPSVLGGAYELRECTADLLERLQAEVRASPIPEARRAAIRCSAVPGPADAMLARHAHEHDVDLVVIGAPPRGLLVHSVVCNSRRIASAVPGDLLMVRAARTAG